MRERKGGEVKKRMKNEKKGALSILAIQKRFFRKGEQSGWKLFLLTLSQGQFGVKGKKGRKGVSCTAKKTSFTMRRGALKQENANPVTIVKTSSDPQRNGL